MVGPGVNDRLLQPAELENAAVEDEPVARNQPLGVRRLERADRHAAVHDPHRLLGVNRPHVAPEPAGHPPARGCRTSPCSSRFAAKSSAGRLPARARTHPPARPGRRPARRGRRRNPPAPARPSGPPCGRGRRPASTFCSPAHAMLTNCWQTTSSGARIMRSGSTRPARAARAVMIAPASSAGVAASNSPREPAPRRWPDRPTRCTHRATPPGSPTWTVTSAVPMSTPSSRLVLVTTARSSPARSAFSISRRLAASRAE